MEKVLVGLALVWGAVAACLSAGTLHCPRPAPAPRSNCIINGTFLLCCYLKSNEQIVEALGNYVNLGGVVEVELRNTSLVWLDAGLEVWSRLEHLTLGPGSRLTRIRGSFRGRITCLALPSLGLTEIDPTAFLALPRLRILDLSANNFTNMPQIPSSLDHLTLDISENPRINCQSVKNLVDNLQNSSSNVTFKNEEKSFCLTSHSFTWFNSTEIIPVAEVLKQKDLAEDCPKTADYKCHCSPYRVDLLPGQFPKVIAKVDCSNLGLTQLPHPLPPNTKFLNVTNNNITSLDILSFEKSYHEIMEFHADYNQIASISVLESSYFLNNFAILSLRWNNLTTIPTYILSNAFDGNKREPKVKLGGNKLKCDCTTFQRLKIWLRTNKDYIPDYDEVLCAEDLEKVVLLDINKVCVFKKEWTDYISYIIASEILLLVLLLSKVFYDYWVFKTTGYLPWPASKMPKLPCDWVFEL